MCTHNKAIGFFLEDLDSISHETKEAGWEVGTYRRAAAVSHNTWIDPNKCGQ